MLKLPCDNTRLYHRNNNKLQERHSRMSSIIIIDNERQESRLNDCKSATSIDKTQAVEAFYRKELKKGQNRWRSSGQSLFVSPLSEISFEIDGEHVTSRMNTPDRHKGAGNNVSANIYLLFHLFSILGIIYLLISSRFSPTKTLSRIPRRTKTFTFA